MNPADFPIIAKARGILAAVDQKNGGPGIRVGSRDHVIEMLLRIISELEDRRNVGVQAARLALFVIRKQGVMPNSRWEAGLNQYLALAMGEAKPRCWKHRKRGTTYVEIGRGRLQAELWRDMGANERFVDGEEMVFYRADRDGSLWVRPVTEFEDGRFEEIKA